MFLVEKARANVGLLGDAGAGLKKTIKDIGETVTNSPGTSGGEYLKAKLIFKN